MSEDYDDGIELEEDEDMTADNLQEIKNEIQDLNYTLRSIGILIGSIKTLLWTVFWLVVACLFIKFFLFGN